MKQVRMIDQVDEDLAIVVKYRKTIAPHKVANKQFVVADLITREAKRIKKILGE